MQESSLKRSWPFVEHEQNSSTPTPTPNFQQDTRISSIPEENTCFGCIVGETALLNENISYRYLAEFQSSRSFALIPEGHYFALECSGINFARLNKGVCRCFQALVAQQQVRIQAYVPDEVWDMAASSWRALSRSKLPIEINIYGSQRDAGKVGSILSKSGIYLQFPRYGLGDVEYYNPHFFRMEGYPSQVPIETMLSTSVEVVGTSNRTADEEVQVNDSDAVDEILDSLSHRTLLGDILVDRRIRSALHPHQREAVDFVAKRETGQVPSELSLWKYNDVDADEPFYQHVFSGAKRPNQEEAEGGIIADEMGLGKSLVILSTIAGSLDRAERFVASEDRPISSQQRMSTHSRATLIVVPSSLLIDNWVNEIRKHSYPGSLSFHKHLGQQRHQEKHLLLQQAIVFTTYATVAAEFSRGNSDLTKINWFRIVLDEAHDIRNRRTNQFKAVVALPAKHRWCLTGTPIQNSIEDLGALTSFLKVPILSKAPTFQKFITSPATSSTKDRFKNLQTLLESICLRRTRELLPLPRPLSYVREVCLTPSERQEYNNLVQQGRTQIEMVVSGYNKGKISSIVLQSILKLRLFCNNGNSNDALRVDPTGFPSDSDEALTYLQQHEQNLCAYCSSTIYFVDSSGRADGGMFVSPCCHLVCRNCTPHHRARKAQCPVCLPENGPPVWGVSPLIDLQSNLNRRGDNHDARSTINYPSKLLALLADIRAEATQKSIVFSCWKKTLNLVSELLSRHELRHDIIHGSRTVTERSNVLKDFQSLNGPNILLMTLGTGAVGLNLAVASRIYLLEPQWNPSIESQAIGRALRLDQTSQVVIIRYIAAQTVEQADVIFRQRRKLQLVGGGFGKGKDTSDDTLQSLLHVFRGDGTSGSQSSGG